jgi:hypothetical protein
MVQLLAREMEFSLFNSARGAIDGYRGSFPGIKRTKREAGHSPRS